MPRFCQHQRPCILPNEQAATYLKRTRTRERSCASPTPSCQRRTKQYFYPGKEACYCDLSTKTPRSQHSWAPSMRQRVLGPVERTPAPRRYRYSQAITSSKTLLRSQWTKKMEGYFIWYVIQYRV